VSYRQLYECGRSRCQPSPCRWCSGHGRLHMSAIFSLAISSCKRTVVGSILLAADQQLRVKQLAVWTGSDLVDGLFQSACGPLRCRLSHTDGSKSTKMERGTYLPLLVSLKKVSNEPPSDSAVASGFGRPSGKRPCSSRYLGTSCQRVFEVYDRDWMSYSSQAAFPSWIPHCPMWRWAISPLIVRWMRWSRGGMGGWFKR
jgi:hypothetical protein